MYNVRLNSSLQRLGCWGHCRRFVTWRCSHWVWRRWRHRAIFHMVCYSRLLRRCAPGLPFTACCFRFRTFRGRYHRQWAKTPSALLARGKGWRLRPQTNNQIKPHIWRVVGCLVHTLCRRRPRPRSPPVELYQVGAVRAWDIFFARLAGLAGGRHSRKD